MVVPPTSEEQSKHEQVSVTGLVYEMHFEGEPSVVQPMFGGAMHVHLIQHKATVLQVRIPAAAFARTLKLEVVRSNRILEHGESRQKQAGCGSTWAKQQVVCLDIDRRLGVAAALDVQAVITVSEGPKRARSAVEVRPLTRGVDSTFNVAECSNSPRLAGFGVARYHLAPWS